MRRTLNKTLIGVNSYLIAGPAEQETGADWRAVARVASARVQRLLTAHYYDNHRWGDVDFAILVLPYIRL